MAVDLTQFADIGRYEPWLRPLIARLVEAGVLTGTRHEDGRLYLDLDGPMAGWRVAALIARLVDRDLLIRDQELAELRERVSKSIVAITTANGQIAGAGVVIRPTLVVTAHHVVQGALNRTGMPFVSPRDGVNLPIKIHRWGLELDLVALDVPDLTQYGLAPAQVGPVPPVGAQVMAVGMPLGVRHYTTLGIISDTTMKMQYYYAAQDMVPTDTPINPGNSGGGLFDMSGRLVGFTLMKIVDPSVEAFGFAEPAEPALKALGVI